MIPSLAFHQRRLVERRVQEVGIEAGCVESWQRGCERLAARLVERLAARLASQL